MKRTYALTGLLLASLVWGQETPRGRGTRVAKEADTEKTEAFPKADVDPSKSPFTLEDLQKVPERKIKIQKSDSVTSMLDSSRSSKTDDKTEYMGIIRMVINDNYLWGDLTRNLQLSLGSGYPSNAINDLNLLLSVARRSGSTDIDLSLLIAQLPEPQKSELGKLAVKPFFAVGISPQNADGNFERHLAVAFVGDSPESVEKSASNFLKILDWGFFRPARLRAFSNREDAVKKWLADKSELDQLQSSINKIKDEMEKYSDYSIDMSSELRLQHIKLDVDIAGLKATIAKYEEIAQPSKAITDSLVASRIELVGLHARMAKLDEHIAKIKKKSALSSQLDQLTTQFTRATNLQKSMSTSLLKSIDTLVARYASPPLVEDKIFIYPIKLVPPKEQPRRGGGPPQTPLGKTGNPG